MQHILVWVIFVFISLVVIFKFHPYCWKLNIVSY